MTQPVENHPCDMCGQLDDHPMVHVLGVWEKDAHTIVRDPSFHFDCIPASLEQSLRGGDGEALPQHARTVAAVDAAKSGVHGDKLRAHIATLPDDNTVEV